MALPEEPRTPGESGQPRDWTDDHVARWQPVLPGLDPVVEGAVTRMKKLSVHFRRVREQSLADFDLERYEFDTLHKLAGRGGSAAPPNWPRTSTSPPPPSRAASKPWRSADSSAVHSPRPTGAGSSSSSPTCGHQTWLGAMDVLGHEEYRLLGVLSAEERNQLNDLLRRIMVEAESAEHVRHWD